MSQASAFQFQAEASAVVAATAAGARPRLSVIVPVYNGAAFLHASLTALRASDLPATQWELIVVDDASRDRSRDIAAGYADRVIVLEDAPGGPAHARNRGAAVAFGDALVFVDADVCVHPDALRRFAETFEGEPDVSAVFGAYDLAPTAAGLISQYRNLLHRYVHQRDAGDAVTFWAGCGAVRAAVFASSGGFDDTEYVKASVEDIELGYRLSALGHRIVLRPEIQGRHMKQWTLRDMVDTDVRRRGVPWMRLLLSQKDRPTATLNLRASEQVCTMLMVAGCLALGMWLWHGGPSWLAAAAALSAIIVINGPLFAWLARQRGWGFALAAVPLRLLYYTLNAISVLMALLSVGLSRRPLSPRTDRGMGNG